MAKSKSSGGGVRINNTVASTPKGSGAQRRAPLARSAGGDGKAVRGTVSGGSVAPRSSAKGVAAKGTPRPQL